MHLSPSLCYFSLFSSVLKSSSLIKSPDYFCTKDDILLMMHDVYETELTQFSNGFQFGKGNM